ncbi:hypothetical protein F5Y00DRAFT_243307 [Daldinia vernicosa]|uniref:uncharacterized protein n=1 Tax=Daldinia vernicosa TaxID=114800 RepID=UPI002007B1D0|nr:uncharacterized protein F5Y00DRAFT_243307 [Daldinia vernicosa]KAI0846701.1 hypothetical protein F5Y00DRAFT_243307 [Daldinia vernicosa]
MGCYLCFIFAWEKAAGLDYCIPSFSSSHLLYLSPSLLLTFLRVSRLYLIISVAWPPYIYKVCKISHSLRYWYSVTYFYGRAKRHILPTRHYLCTRSLLASGMTLVL